MQSLRIVRSKAGRDKDRLFIVLREDTDGYLEIADGMLRTLDKPKRKKPRHLETVLESYDCGESALTDKTAAKIIKKLSAEPERKA